MSARRTAALTATTAGAITALTLVAATAAAAGSDSPTPYRVTGAGIELPAGDAFAVHDHVNVTYTSGLGAGSRNVHIEGPGSRFGDLAGASALTWDRAGLPPDACVTWVQVAGYDEHHGEGGQAPVCRTTTVVTPPPASTPAPPATPAPAPTTAPPTTPPAPAPAETVSSAPSPAPSTAPSTSPAPTPVAPSEPAATPTPTAEVVAAPEAPAPTERSEVLPAADDATPGPSAGQAGQVRAATEDRSEVLAATGARTGVVLGVATLALALGTALVAWRRRTSRA